MSKRPKWLKNIDISHGNSHTEMVQNWLEGVILEIKSPYNDGFTASGLKRELYEFKCLLEDLYETLPDFGEEEIEWEKERLYNKLKKRNNK